MQQRVHVTGVQLVVEVEAEAIVGNQEQHRVRVDLIVLMWDLIIKVCINIGTKVRGVKVGI